MSDAPPTEAVPYNWALEEPIAVMARGKKTDLSELKKVAWEQRAAQISKRFESVDKLNWSGALERDMELFGRILRDILKLEQAVPGRPGPRPSLDINDAIRRMQQFLGHDFTLLSFVEAFKILANGRSGRQMARIVDLDRNTIQRLLCGEMEPDGYHMRMVAEGFGKHPSYFLEWRILYITAAIVRRLEWNPEATVGMFRRLDAQRKLAAS